MWTSVNSLHMSVHVNEWYVCSLFFRAAYLCDLLHVLFCDPIQVALFPGETGTAGPGQQWTGSFGKSTSQTPSIVHWKYPCDMYHKHPSHIPTTIIMIQTTCLLHHTHQSWSVKPEALHALYLTVRASVSLDTPAYLSRAGKTTLHVQTKVEAEETVDCRMPVVGIIDILVNVILALVFQFMMFFWDIAQLYLFIQWTLEIQQRIIYWTVWLNDVTIILDK